MEKKTSKITIAEIARRANINRKTFYLHYSSIDDIINEVSENKVEELLSLLEEKDFFAHPFDVNLFFQCLNYMVLQDIDFYKKIVGDPTYITHFERIKDLLINTMKKIYADQDAIPQDELDIYTVYFASAIVSTYMAWLNGDIKTDINKLGEIAADATHFGALKLLH